jgi:hypothetical protein
MKGLRRILFILTGIVFSHSAFSQEYMYVKKQTFLREFPDTTSKPLLVLYPPCKVLPMPITDKGYEGYTDNWMAINFFSSDGTRYGGETFKGFIRKEDLTSSLTDFNTAEVDTSITIHYALVDQNGEKIYPPLRFLDSSHGGCYYINSAAKKEYVQGRYCEK